MKKLLLTVIGVAIVFVGFITILYMLPCNQGRWHRHDRCEMKDGVGKCDDKDMGDGKEHRTEKVWIDADGKEHREVMVTIGGDGEMGNCPMDKGQCEMGKEQCQMGKEHCTMDSMMGGKCNMEKMGDGKCDMNNMQMGCCGMGMHGCCCCCMMMMNGGHCNVETDEKGEKWEKKNDSVKIKVRSKL